MKEKKIEVDRRSDFKDRARELIERINIFLKESHKPQKLTLKPALCHCNIEK
jgi:hypothetical protein